MSAEVFAKYVARALMNLRPQAAWEVSGNHQYSDINWLDTEQTQPTEAEVQAEVTRLQADYEAKQYQRDRVAEYPSVNDYLDGIVKGDTAQVQAYIDACLAVKAKYPKPE